MRPTLLPALGLAFFATGCFGDGPDAIHVYLNLQSDDRCGFTEVILDLDAAEAEILRDDSGWPECELAEALEESGCELDYEDIEGGKFLALRVSGCALNFVTALAACDFASVLPATLGQHVTSSCTCADETCTTVPGICISESDDPATCEDCENGVDDDGNGDTDCDDPYCINDSDCYFSTTTESTTTSSTSGGHTTFPPTTSTTLDIFQNCTVVFRLTDQVELGALQWSIDYSGLNGRFLGNGSNVECASLVDRALSSFNAMESVEILSAGIISIAGFTGPLDVAECMVKVSSSPEAGDFEIVVVDAADLNSAPVTPLPAVVLANVDCEAVE